MKIVDIVGKYSVLCVEDNPTIRLTMEYMLRDIFKIVHVAENGVEGLEKYQDFYQENKSYNDVVFTDMNMPLMDGLELTKNIIEVNPNQKILVISAHNESDILENAINAGASDYLFKPITAVDLIEKIEKLLG